MANPHLSTTLAEFEATVHRTKNRLVAIPSEVQRKLRLVRKRSDPTLIVFYSIRLVGRGRWNHHLSYLTHDNEFAVPADVTHIRPGSQVEVKVRRIIPDADALTASEEVPANPGALLLSLADQAGDDETLPSSGDVDEYLYGDERRG